MKTILGVTLAVLAMTVISAAQEPPDAPSALIATNNTVAEPGLVEPGLPLVARKIDETRRVDRRFVTLAIISTGSTFADSYTTLFARQNWLAGKQGVCNVEVQSAYLYGTHPTVARAYAVASVKSVGSVIAAYYLRKHHSRLWSLPLISNSVVSLQGTIQNLGACN